MNPMQSHAQTSEDEYDFCVKGYPLVLTSGIDMKAGYHVERGYSETKMVFKMSLLYLVRRDGSVAAGIMTHEAGPADSTKYFCIPLTGSSDAMIRKAQRRYQDAFISPMILKGAMGRDISEFMFLYDVMQATIGKVRLK